MFGLILEILGYQVRTQTHLLSRQPPLQPEKYGLEATIQPGRGQSRKRQRFGPAPGEATVDKLMELVGRGDTHISTAAELARTIQSDFGASSVGIRDLASCGADGKHESNTERDFWTWTKGAYKFHVEPYQIKLTLHAS